MEQDSYRGRGRPTTYNCNSDLRRPHNNRRADDPTTLTTSGAGSSTPISAYPNVMPASVPSGCGDFVPTVSRTDNTPYSYSFGSEVLLVPANSQQHLQEPQISVDAIKNSVLSPLAKEFVPKTFVQSEAPAPTGSNVSSQLEYMVCLVHEFIYEVTLNPGKFDEEVILLTETLNVMVKSPELMKALIEIIFKQAIQEPNFRYNGARLCNHLNQNLLNDSKVQSFRYFLLEKCQYEYEKKNMLINCEPQYLRGLIFFFGELYSQILQPTGARIDILRNAIICLLDALLTEPSQDNVKCACQVIKMTGANLEDHERCLDDQEKIRPEFIGLDKICNKLKLPEVRRELEHMVQNVITLRECNWGRSSISNDTQPLPPPPPPTHVLPGGAVFYGPDGQPISSEETLFLESQAYYDYRGDTYDEDFNDEIAAAYESFLRQMGQ